MQRLFYHHNIHLTTAKKLKSISQKLGVVSRTHHHKEVIYSYPLDTSLTPEKWEGSVSWDFAFLYRSTDWVHFSVSWLAAFTNQVQQNSIRK